MYPNELKFYKKLKISNENENFNTLIIYSIENSFRKKYLNLKNEEKKSFLIDKLEEFEEIINTPENEENFSVGQFLIAIGVFRFCLFEIAKSYMEDIKEINSDIFSLLKKTLNKSNDFPIKYLRKCIFKLYGRIAFFDLKEIEGLTWLIPSRSVPEYGKPDTSVVYNNENYFAIRNCFDQHKIEENIFNEQFFKQNKHFVHLALYSSLSILKSNEFPDQVKFS